MMDLNSIESRISYLEEQILLTYDDIRHAEDEITCIPHQPWSMLALPPTNPKDSEALLLLHVSVEELYLENCIKEMEKELGELKAARDRIRLG